MWQAFPQLLLHLAENDADQKRRSRLTLATTALHRRGNDPSPPLFVDLVIGGSPVFHLSNPAKALSGQVGSSSEIGALDQLPQSLPQIRWLIERVPTVNIRTPVIKRLDRLIRLRHSLAHLTDAIASEQQIFWINVACLYEAAGLLGASAGVRLVYETALIVHEVAKVPAGAGQPLAKALATDLQYLGRDCVGDPEDLAEDVGKALLTIETQEHAGCAGDHSFATSRRTSGRCDARLGRIQVRCIVDRLAIGAETYDRLLRSPTLHIQYMVDYHAIEPSSEAASALERR